jgi:putative ABC transport system permease protein
MVSAGSGGFGPVRQGQGAVTTLTAEDADAIRREVPGIRYLSPGINTRVQIVSESSNWNTQVQGAGADLVAIRSWPMQFGSFFTDDDVRRGAKVAVLGSVTRDQLFGPGADATGAIVRIKNQPFQVVGVLTSKGQAAMGQDQDDTVLIPYSTVQKKLLGVQHLNNITVSAQDGVPLDTMTQEVSTVLRTRHRIQPGSDDDFMVRTLEEMTSMLTSTTNTMTYLLAGIAAVSLIVGGIGIMNIMLVNVTERTREIGIRLAIGALASEVLLQFLVEAIVLSMFGGVIGIGLGLVGSYFATRSLGLPFALMPEILVLSFGFSALIGVAFGYLPAHKAARLNPIEALRHE